MGGGRRRTLGVVGTLVWDTIHPRDRGRAPVEEWGGIGYALEALSAALPPEWDILPLIRVGRDLAEEAFRFLAEIPRVRGQEGVLVVPEANNRVELRYLDGHRRTECLRGGVSPWSWMELGPRLAGCDALYVNFISGHEMGLDTARSLRVGFGGPIYADLHSLFLGLGQEGLRIPQPLPAWDEWLRCFDAVQMNEEEFDLLGRARGDAWALAAEVVGNDLKLVCVTLGARGAAYVASPAFDADPMHWPGTRGRLAGGGAFRSGHLPLEESPLDDGDPTGCGDVWGATLIARLLAGDVLEGALQMANRNATRNVSHSGARGLHLHLQRRLVTGGVRT